MVGEIGTGVIVGIVLIYLGHATLRSTPGFALQKAVLVVSGLVAFVTAFLISVDVLSGSGPATLGFVALGLCLGSCVWLFFGCMNSQERPKSNKITR